jgi:gliding motility-associated-like protein
MITNNGTFDISNFGITVGQITNTDSMRFDKYLYVTGKGTVVNSGVIADVDSLWNDGLFLNMGSSSKVGAVFIYNNDTLLNEGHIGFLAGANAGWMANSGLLVGMLFVNESEFDNDNGGRLNLMDFWNTGDFHNWGGSAINIARDFYNGDTLLPLSGPFLYNNGFIGVGNDFANGDSIIGDSGRFCIGQYSANWGYVGGALQVCDNTPTAGIFDLSIGPVGPSVTGCVDSCAMVVRVEYYEPTCSGGNDGSIVLNAYGGSSLYAYDWSNGNTSDGMVNLEEGVYIILITDGNDTNYVVVDLFTPPIVAEFATEDASCDMANGTASVAAFGGSSSYIFTWSDGQVGPTVVGLAPGAYEVTITNAKGCSITESVTVLAVPNITVNKIISRSTCLNTMDGEVALTVAGGVPPYEYAWTPEVSAGPVATGLAVGDYTIIITDDDSCSATTTATVTIAGGADCMEWKVFSGITPDDDGIDDHWVIRGLNQYRPVAVEIFTNRGIKVWSSVDYDNDWEGTDQNGVALAEGVYYYILSRPDAMIKGWVHITR